MAVWQPVEVAPLDFDEMEPVQGSVSLHFFS
jgi:hypothetical protein